VRFPVTPTAQENFNMLLINEVRIAICQWRALVSPQSPNELEEAFAELEAFYARMHGERSDASTKSPTRIPSGPASGRVAAV
jgi:hypothetical protein